jgi:hypothetical protein
MADLTTLLTVIANTQTSFELRNASQEEMKEGMKTG